MEVKNDNELIAGFMGLIKSGDGLWYFESSDGIRTYFQRQDLKYEVSWDWLMTAVEKIERLYSENFPLDFLQKILAKEPNGTEPYIDVVALPLSTPKQEAFKAVVDFIKWYNSTPKEGTDQ